MKKYRVEVAMSYLQTIEVEAEDMDSAEQQAYEKFDIAKAYQGDGQIVWTTCLDEPSWLDQPVPLEQ